MAGGRPAIFNNKEELRKKIDEYFEYINSKNEIPTISKLSYYIGFASRQSIYDYKKNYPEYKLLIEDAIMRTQPTNNKTDIKYKKGISQSERIKIRRENDVHFKLSMNMASVIRYYLKNRDSFRNFQQLGYTSADLIRHFEKLFKKGMSWDNYGKWQIDHVKPISAFKYSSTEDKDFIKCWSLNNLQPLWKTDNIIKGAYYG